MFKLIDWFTQNWKAITLILLFIFVFGLIKPLTDALRNFKEGFKQIFTPMGFLVFIVLIALVVFLVYFFKGSFV